MYAIRSYYVGNISEAQDYIRMFIESFTRSINGGRTPTDKEIIDWVTLANPFKYPEDTVSLVDGLKRAGLSQATAAQSGTVIIPSRKPLPPTPSIFKQEKDVWRIEYENIEVILPDIKGYHRITSYNVCYTKLLRRSAPLLLGRARHV